MCVCVCVCVCVSVWGLREGSGIIGFTAKSVYNIVSSSWACEKDSASIHREMCVCVCQCVCWDQ